MVVVMSFQCRLIIGIPVSTDSKTFSAGLRSMLIMMCCSR